jgi:hypothetical protein
MGKLSENREVKSSKGEQSATLVTQKPRYISSLLSMSTTYQAAR